MNEELDNLRAELEAEMDLGEIRQAAYREVLMEEIADDVRRKAREEAEADVQNRYRQRKKSR